MVDIYTVATGEHFSYDQETNRIFKDGKLMPSYEYEAVFSGFSDGGIPKFAGILRKAVNSIISLSGTENPVTDINTI